MQRLLKPTESIYLVCDPTASQYAPSCSSIAIFVERLVFGTKSTGIEQVRKATLKAKPLSRSLAVLHKV